MNDARDPRILREALVAQLLGEIDTLLLRVEALVPPIDQAISSLKGSAKDTTAALDRFRATTQAIADQAQTSAVDHIVRRTNVVAKATLDEQTVAMGAAARSLFDGQANPLIHSLIADLRARNSSWLAWLTPAVTALLSSALTVAGIYLLRG